MQKVGEKFIQSAPTNAGTFDFEINWVWFETHAQIWLADLHSLAPVLRAAVLRKKGKNGTKTHYFNILQMQKVAKKLIQSATKNAGTLDLEKSLIWLYEWCITGCWGLTEMCKPSDPRGLHLADQPNATKKHLIIMPTFVDVPEIKLIRTDTTLDLSQKAEKVCLDLAPTVVEVLWRANKSVVGVAYFTQNTCIFTTFFVSFFVAVFFGVAVTVRLCGGVNPLFAFFFKKASAQSSKPKYFRQRTNGRVWDLTGVTQTA